MRIWGGKPLNEVAAVTEPVEFARTASTKNMPLPTNWSNTKAPLVSILYKRLTSPPCGVNAAMYVLPSSSTAAAWNDKGGLSNVAVQSGVAVVSCCLPWPAGGSLLLGAPTQAVPATINSVEDKANRTGMRL